MNATAVLIGIGLLFFSTMAEAKHYDLAKAQARLESEIQTMQADSSSGPSLEARMSIVEHFVFALKKLDDFGLGSHELAGKAGTAETEVNLVRLKNSIQALLVRYQQEVRPILLQNIRLKRSDKGASHNKGSLIALFFATRNNHHTSKFMSGIWQYPEDISSSMFSSEQVDAGLSVNFPELKDAEWVQQGFTLEAELIALLRMHREYLDGAKYEKIDRGVVAENQKKQERRSPLLKAKPTLSQEYGIDMAQVEKSLHDYSYSSSENLDEGERMDVIHNFVEALKDLNEEDAHFQDALHVLCEKYKQEVKPILLTNVRSGRDDLGSRSNAGDILSLFFKKQFNHNTGKPVTGKLLYKVDNSSFFGEKNLVEKGLLTEHPELRENQTIKDALLMEAELRILSMQHNNYLKDSGFIF